MNTSFLTVITCLALSAGMLTAAETKVKMKDLPPAAQAAVRAETAHSSLVGLSREVENGKTVYEAETKVNGRGRDVTFDAAGKVVAVEEEVALESIPAGARQAIERRAAGGTVTRVEKVTEGGKTAYEAAIKVKGKTSEFEVGADGSPVQ